MKPCLIEILSNFFDSKDETISKFYILMYKYSTTDNEQKNQQQTWDRKKHAYWSKKKKKHFSKINWTTFWVHYQNILSLFFYIDKDTQNTYIDIFLSLLKEALFCPLHLGIEKLWSYPTNIWNSTLIELTKQKWTCEVIL